MNTRFGNPHPGVPSNEAYRQQAIEQFNTAEIFRKITNKEQAAFCYMDCISNIEQITYQQSEDVFLKAKSHQALAELERNDGKLPLSFEYEATYRANVDFLIAKQKRLIEENAELKQELLVAEPLKQREIQHKIAQNRQLHALTDMKRQIVEAEYAEKALTKAIQLHQHKPLNPRKHADNKKALEETQEKLGALYLQINLLPSEAQIRSTSYPLEIHVKRKLQPHEKEIGRPAKIAKTIEENNVSQEMNRLLTSNSGR